MRIIIKTITYVIIALLLSICLIKLINVNIISNELNNASSLAMESTQRIMKEIIINKEFNIDQDNTFYIDANGNNINYADYYIRCFKDNVKDSSIYDIKIDANEEYGIIYVEIDNNYSSLIPIKKLLNIVEIVEK